MAQTHILSDIERNSSVSGNLTVWTLLLNCDFWSYSLFLPPLVSIEKLQNGPQVQKSFSVQTFVCNPILLTDLEFSCTVGDLLCPWRWFLMDFNVIWNYKFVLFGVLRKMWRKNCKNTGKVIKFLQRKKWESWIQVSKKYLPTAWESIERLKDNSSVNLK